MENKTVLHGQHKKNGAILVNFAGWQMPLHYGSQIQEHHVVRQDSGLFDVSHMLAVDIAGENAIHYLSFLLANNPQRLIPGKALYTCMLNNAGGILDDLIVYQLSQQLYRVVINAGNRLSDLDWMKNLAQHYSSLSIVERTDLAIIAIQGPHAISKASKAFNASQQSLIKDLKPFHCVQEDNWCIARTGYTGEDGLEVILPIQEAENFWQHLIELGSKPCGLGARDTLRLEAGLNLYGSDMNATTTPLESNLAWTIAWDPVDRDFIGRQALIKQQENLSRKLVGLVLEEKGRILRNHQKLITSAGAGEITSGSYSPTLGSSIAFARIPYAHNEDYCDVIMGSKQYKARIIKAPFIRKGKKTFS
ncbi:MAG: glycine cleavage system aminomethyltransferase GcvT [Candidatus Aquirickettsiella sp.]